LRTEHLATTWCITKQNTKKFHTGVNRNPPCFLLIWAEFILIKCFLCCLYKCGSPYAFTRYYIEWQKSSQVNSAEEANDKKKLNQNKPLTWKAISKFLPSHIVPLPFVSNLQNKQKIKQHANYHVYLHSCTFFLKFGT